MHLTIASVIPGRAKHEPGIALRGCLPDVSNVSAARCPAGQRPVYFAWGCFHENAVHSIDRPAAIMMPSISRRKTSGSRRSTKRLAMKAPNISDEPGNEALDRDIGCQRAEAFEGDRFG